MSVECRLELCAESIAPSRICAQLQLTMILTIATLLSGVGANAGASNSGISSAGPMYTQTKPPASRVGYAMCFTFSTIFDSAGSDDISTTLPSTSIFQP